jgi:hypothetical protein
MLFNTIVIKYLESFSKGLKTVIISLTPDILAVDITRSSVDNVQDIAEGN